ncbi:unnamed protein product, partial [Leptidea sinapis]
MVLADVEMMNEVSTSGEVSTPGGHSISNLFGNSQSLSAGGIDTTDPDSIFAVGNGTAETEIAIQPHFDNSSKREYTAAVGQPAYLHCLSKAEILSGPELFVRAGSDINLTCIARHAPDPPSFIYWYRGTNVVNYAQRGGISVETEQRTRTSRLLIARASPRDSGNYTCAP